MAFGGHAGGFHDPRGPPPTGEERLHAMRERHLSMGTEAAVHAVAADHGGNHEQALGLYRAAVDAFAQADAFMPDGPDRDTLRRKVAGYRERAEALSQMLAKRRDAGMGSSGHSDGGVRFGHDGRSLSGSSSGAAPGATPVVPPGAVPEAQTKGDAAFDAAIKAEQAKDRSRALTLYREAGAAYLDALRSLGLSPAASKGHVISRRLDMVLDRAEALKKSLAASTAPARARAPKTGTGAPSGRLPDVPAVKPSAPPRAPRSPARPPGTTGDGCASGGAGGPHGAPPSAGIPPPLDLDSGIPEPLTITPIVGPGRGGRGGPRGSGGSGASGMGVKLTEAEKKVLRRTSVVNGHLFLPWIDSDLDEQFRYPKPFRDPDGLLPMSAKQQRRFAAWKRPSEFMSAPKMIQLVSPYSITQELVGDCSFVSSLIIAAAYERRHHKQLITSIIYPQNSRGEPIYNPSGKYMIKLHYNGVPRKVIVDDLLPVDSRKKLFMSFSNNANELWVSLIEKAYMKLHGGYDFPGSNSGVDLFCLTGWLPEPMHVDEDGFNPDRTWERVLGGSRNGDVLITIATGRMSEAEEERWGLVETHAYAVLDARDVRGLRMVLVKNPWAHKRWKGKYSAHDTTNWTPFLKSALNYDQERAQMVDNGIFWIDWTSLLQHFNAIYMNWNPELFKYQRKLHATWPAKAPGPESDHYNVGYNPQYSLEVDVPTVGKRGRPASDAIVWLVLTRHSTKKETAERRRGEGRGGADPDQDYLALHLYDGERGGRRVFHPQKPYYKGVYTPYLHSLFNFTAPPGKNTYTIVVSQWERTRDIDYTLDVYSAAPVILGQVTPLARHEVSIKGSWTAATAGGSPRHPTFFNNPQFRVTTKRDGPFSMRVEVPEENQFVNVRMFASGGNRVDSYGGEMMTSGSYRQQVAVVSQDNLGAGSYTVIVSTFEPNKLGSFTLIVGSDAGTPSLSRIAAEGEGMIKRRVAGAWRTADRTAAGCSNHGHFMDNPKYKLVLDRTTRVVARLDTERVVPQPAINLSIWHCPDGALPPRLDIKSALASTHDGVYMEKQAGVSTGEVELRPGTYVLVPSTFDPTPCSFTLTLFTSQPAVIRPFA